MSSKKGRTATAGMQPSAARLRKPSGSRPKDQGRVKMMVLVESTM